MPDQAVFILHGVCHHGRLDRLACPHGLGGRLDGILDGRIPGAAAQRIFQGRADILAGGVRILLQQGVSGHDLARDAKPALDRAMDDEGFLQRVQAGLSILRAGQAFDRYDLLPFGAFSRIGTRQDRLAVNQHGATAAFGFVAADLGAGQAQPAPEQLGQRFAGLRRQADFLVINCKC